MSTRPPVTIDLRRQFILLSASFPYGDRAERFPPGDPGAIADAVVAVARGTLMANGRLVFGGHPTISPLVLMVALELGVPPQSVLIYQSTLFRSEVTAETLELERRGQGEIRWVDAQPDETIEIGLEHLRSLESMRRRMIAETAPVASFFVGGMEGVIAEWTLVRELRPRAPAMAIGTAGGAAANLPLAHDLSGELGDALKGSRLYPSIVGRALSFVADASH